MVDVGDLSLYIGTIGALLTVIAILAQSHQATNARRERADRAKNEIATTLTKAFIHDEIPPDLDLISDVVARNVRQHKIRPSDLDSALSFIEDLVASLAENNFIEANKKRKLIGDFLTFQKRITERPEAVPEPAADSEQTSSPLLILATAAITTFLVGGVLYLSLRVLFPLLPNGNSFLSTFTILTEALVPTLGVATAVVAYRFSRTKLNEKDAEVIRERRYSAPAFERIVADSLGEVFPSAEIIQNNGQTDKGADFIVKASSKTYDIFVKYYSSAVSNVEMRHMVANIERTHLKGSVTALITNAQLTAGALRTSRRANLVVIESIRTKKDLLSQLRSALTGVAAEQTQS